MADYNALFQVPNAGASFLQSFQQGQQTAQQNAGKAAMAALVQDPNNPRALAALARIDPQTAMEFRKQQIENQKALLAQHQDSILKGAEILREVKPTDQASYTHALALAQQAGIDISQVPQQYSPDYVQGVIHLADAWKPQQDPSPIREFDEAIQRGLLPQGTSYQQFLQMKNPGMLSPVTIPYGATVSTPGQTATTTATDAHGNKVQFNPQSGQWEPMGGAGGNVSGGFPGPH